MVDPTAVVFDNPALTAALAVALILALHYQRGLTWTEYRTLHRLKLALFPTLDRRVWDGFVNPKGRPGEDAEYLTTVAAPLREVVAQLRDGGGSYPLLNSIKRRPGEHGDPLSAAHVVFDHGTDQTEAFLFANDDDGTTDVYVHFEPSPETPLQHLGGGQQQDGDPRGVVDAALS